MSCNFISFCYSSWQGHGALADFLTDKEVSILICGGIGGGAQSALHTAGIQIFGGVSGNADSAIKDYLVGKLNFDPDRIFCAFFIWKKNTWNPFYK